MSAVCTRPDASKVRAAPAGERTALNHALWRAISFDRATKFAMR